MNKMNKTAVAASAAVLMLSLAACQARQGASVDPTEPIVQAAPAVTEGAIVTTPETTPMQFWDDVVVLISPEGESTTVYLLADGRYLDRQDRFFTFDGLESWTAEDGTVWSRKPDVDLPTTNVYAEFAVERLLSQRTDYLFFSDAAGSSYANKIVLTFDTPVTNFRFWKLEGTVNESGEYTCTDMQELYYYNDVIRDGDLMVVETELGEVLPTKGISFSDASGNTQYYYITISGKDNVPLLVHFG